MSGKTISYRLALAMRAGAENAERTAEEIRAELRRLESEDLTRPAGTPNEDDAAEWDKDAELIRAFLAEFDEEALP
jgi:hypothetical protein